MLRVLICSLACLFGVHAGNPDRIRLEDLSVLTLYNGHRTSSRRSQAVPQLKCVGGTAGCNSFVPQVVQCYNKGSNGYDVQWECKTDMDNEFRFGQIVVSCEGYDYPDDPYVLRGSCGLEYTLDFTKEGYQNQGHGWSHYKSKTDFAGSLASVVIFIIALVVIFVLVRMCHQHHSTDVPPPPYPGTAYPSAPPPPPPGFRPEFTSSYDGCSHRQGGGGGFWTGAMTGGALGYLFGSRGQQRHHDNRYYSPTMHQPSSLFSTTDSSPQTSSQQTSSGTRTASGFGGTKRR
jgi:hypothetical protein